MEREHHGFFYGVLAAVANSGSALFVKLATSASVGTLVFSRFLLYLPLIFWMAHRKDVVFSWRKVPQNLIRSIGGLLSLYAYFYSVNQLVLVNAVTLSTTAPLFLPFLVLIWQKLIVSKRRFIASAVGFIGVVILLRPVDNFPLLPSLIALSSGLFGAIAFISVRQLSKIESPESILVYYFLIGTVISFYPCVLDWKPISDSRQWLYIFLNATCSFVFQYALTRAYVYAPATKVGPLSYLSVVCAGLFGWLVFGEVPDVWVVVGILVILVGAFLALFDKSTPRPIKKL